MGGLAEKMVIEAVDALSSGDTALAQQVVETDPRLDLLQREIEEHHATNIAETVAYLVTGSTPPAERPRGRLGTDLTLATDAQGALK
jgi:phosphate uptake regulator